MKHNGLAFASDYFLTAIAVAAFSSLYVLNAWVGEDAYIIFRVAEQFFAGNGLVWNPDERVQVFTSPLWMMGVLLLRSLTRNLFVGCVIAGYVLSLAALWQLRRVLVHSSTWLVLVLVLMSSAGWMDFTSGGLENALLFVLLAAFLRQAIRVAEDQSGDQYRHARRAGLAAGFLLVTRHDALTMMWPLLVLLGYWVWKTENPCRLTTCLLLLCPLGVWTVFSVLYYGSPFPNTAYAKLAGGVSRIALLKQSQVYWRYALEHDPVSMIVVTVGLLCGRWWCDRVALALTLGVLSHIGYITWIGADYMGGRFYAPIVMVSALLCARVFDVASMVQRHRAALVGLLVIALLAYQYASPASTFRDAERDVFGDVIFYSGVCKGKDQRHGITSFYTYLTKADRSAFPANAEHRRGLAFRSDATEYRIEAAIGMFGYYAGVEKIIIDPLAIADPLLARLPASGVWRAGHFYRCIPPGYEETRVTGRNHIRDPALREYYERVSPIYRGTDLFAWSRLKAILELNTGVLNAYLGAYSPPRPECDDLEWLGDKTSQALRAPAQQRR